MCHGKDQGGNRFGPTLRGLAPHWTADDMASYLLKPQSFHDRNDRMREIAKKYNTMVMPPYDHPHADRLELATWILSLEE
ncbi:hypothetical protein ABI59_22195 [Acidobacteria bacterium Mor1]|nr:hypothetical protein ABI59_22195 [Acidobacteria bacterium Mor1]